METYICVFVPKNKKGQLKSWPFFVEILDLNYSLPVPGETMLIVTGRLRYLTSRFGLTVRSVLPALSVALVKSW
jgi:hypothetical protein